MPTRHVHDCILSKELSRFVIIIIIIIIILIINLLIYWNNVVANECILVADRATNTEPN